MTLARLFTGILKRINILSPSDDFMSIKIPRHPGWRFGKNEIDNDELFDASNNDRHSSNMKSSFEIICIIRLKERTLEQNAVLKAAHMYRQK